MKLNILKVAIALEIAGLAGGTIAGHVTGLATITTGTPANATEVNEIHSSDDSGASNGSASVSGCLVDIASRTYGCVSGGNSSPFQQNMGGTQDRPRPGAVA
jgi:hypothetical protein